MFSPVVLAGPGPGLSEQEGAGSPAVLFLSSTPIGAHVLVDGEALEGLTPLLLRGLPAGRHTFELRKDGHSPRVVTAVLEAGEVQSISVELGGAYLLPSFPEEGSVQVHGSREPAEGRLFQLPEGTYRIRRGADGILEVEPRYRHQGWLTGVDLALPMALAFSGVLTAHDLIYPKRNALQLAPGASLAPATLTAYGVSLALIGLEVALRVHRSRFLRSFEYSTLPVRDEARRAREAFDRAESLLSLGELQEAQRFYTVVLEQHPSSPLYPEALFKVARIHALSGAETMAAMELRLLVERYPTVELYDKARKTLADLALARGEYARGLEELDAIVFADPLFVPEEIDHYRAEVLSAWAGAEPEILPRVAEAYRGLIERYPDSAELPRYRFQLALHLHQTGREREAAAQLQLVQRAGLDPQLAERIRQLEEELRQAEIERER
ncbi:MAG: PEGA domain-containing protein [Spirochaetales bacterium]|nr:PEGA domain-containing protein [Spirochaetales bacterium]